MVPVGRSVELLEFDPGPYGVTIECTEQTTTGPIFPFTGPVEFSDSIEITDPTASFYCDVFNEEIGPIVHEVTVESEVDLGGLDVPRTFPASSSTSTATSCCPTMSNPAGSPQPWRPTVRRGVPVRPRIVGVHRFRVRRPERVGVGLRRRWRIARHRRRRRSDRFANTISCPGATDGSRWSASLTGIVRPVTCSMTSAAGALRVINRVTGQTTCHGAGRSRSPTCWRAHRRPGSPPTDP